MKNLWIIASVMLVSAFFVGCEKENIVPNHSKEDVSYFKKYSINPIEGLLNPDDEQDEKVNITLFHFGNALKNLIQDEIIEQKILTEIELTNFNELNLLALIQDDATLKGRLSKELKKSLKQYSDFDLGITANSNYLDANFDVVEALSSFLVYNNVPYYPAVYTLQPVKTTENAKTVIAIGEQVDADDNIEGWVSNDLILLNTDLITSYEGNVILVGNGDFNLLTAEKSKNSLNNTSNQKAVGDDIYLTDYRIKGCQYRYEKRGDSDVRGFFFTNDPGFGANEKIGNYLWDMSENRVCGQHIEYGDKYFQQIHYNVPGTISGNFYPFATLVGWYELDSYASKKVVGDFTSTGNYFSVEVRMKYSHEFYHSEARDQLSQLWTGTGDTHQFDSNKGTFNTKID